MYAPTAATAGLSLCHHQTLVVPSQIPAIPKTKVRDPMNAQGLAPPMSKWPRMNQRFEDGIRS